MPIFFQQDIDVSTKVAIWKIEEDETFFLKNVPLRKDITHPHKRLQHLAGRYLLKYLFPDFPIELILIADTRKPFLDDELYHFSISHCDEYAAVIVSKTKRVGVDVEIAGQKVERIRHKFVSQDEQKFFSGNYFNQQGGYSSSKVQNLPKDLQISTIIWSCKEAAFKWYGQGNVDFRKHMLIKSIIDKDETRFETIMSFQKNEKVFLNMQSYRFGNLFLSYAIT